VATRRKVCAACTTAYKGARPKKQFEAKKKDWKIKRTLLAGGVHAIKSVAGSSCHALKPVHAHSSKGRGSLAKTSLSNNADHQKVRVRS
jgi:hypothetical protein